MKIAMFTNTYLPHVGGVARSVSTSADILRQLGHDVCIVAPEFDGAEMSSDDVLRVPAIQNFNGSDFSLRLPQPWLISEFIEKFRPDVIHSHHPFLLGDAAVRVAYERRLPLIFTHHTMYEQYTHYVPGDSDSLKRVAVQMATEYCNLCHQVIAPSQSVADLITDRGVSVPICSLPTGVDTHFFANGEASRFRRKHQISDKACVLGHVGRLAEEKNLIFLTTAVSEALQHRPDTIFLVVGDGDSRPQMDRILSSHVDSSRIVFTGRLSGQDLADAYSAMDAFVFASRSETQGMVLAEAMAAGCPVVALDAPGVREIVTDANGRLLSSDAAESDFAIAIMQLTENTKQLMQMSEEALLTAQSFGQDVVAKDLIKVYEQSLDNVRAADGGDLTGWDMLQGRLQAEWFLLEEKASALMASIIETEATQAELV
ncbi:MAG: glycosyltransferase [Planctomycetaceae bacterium]|nr:glycosyltransferase [Planctomycetaceae bacterium]